MPDKTDLQRVYIAQRHDDHHRLIMTPGND